MHSWCQISIFHATPHTECSQVRLIQEHNRTSSTVTTLLKGSAMIGCVVNHIAQFYQQKSLMAHSNTMSHRKTYEETVTIIVIFWMCSQKLLSGA